MDVLVVAIRVQLRKTRDLRNLNLLQQFMASDIDHADPMSAVIADIGFRAVWCEGHIERLHKTGDCLDLRQRNHVDDGDGIPFRIALVVPAAIR